MGTLATVISVIGGAWRLRRQRPALYFGVQETYPITLTTAGHDLYWRLRAQYQQDPNKRVRTADVFVGNRGAVAIRREDFDGGAPITLDFREHRDILHVELAQTTPQDWHPTFSQPNAHALAFAPCLLNSGDAIVLKAVFVISSPSLQVVQSKQNRSTITTRLAGITQYAKTPWLIRQGIPPDRVRDVVMRARRFAGIVFLLALLYLATHFLLLIYFSSPAPVCSTGVSCALLSNTSFFALVVSFFGNLLLLALAFYASSTIRPVSEIVVAQEQLRRANRADEQAHRPGTEQRH